MKEVPTPKFELTLLGRFELTGRDGPIDLTSKKLVGLVAFLACASPEPKRREKLMDLLWGSHFEAQARQNLRQALARLRRVVGASALISDGETVSLHPDAITCDIVRFEALVRRGSRDALAEAVALYKDRLLADIAIPEEAWTEWLEGERQRLEGLALDAMIKLAECELQSGNADSALSAAYRAITVNSLREDAHRLVIRALVGGGRRVEALKHYDHLVALLKRELDVGPDSTTRNIVEEIRTEPRPVQSRPGSPSTAATDETLSPAGLRPMLADRHDASDARLLGVSGFNEWMRASRLPGLEYRPHSQPLVGRRLELERLRRVLGSCCKSGRGQAVHIRGEAGIGKTRLLEEFLSAAREQGFACHTTLVLDFGIGVGRDAIGTLTRDILGLAPNSNQDTVQAAVEAAIADHLVAREDAVFLNDLLDLPQPMGLRAVYEAMDNSTRNTGKTRTMARLVQQATRLQPRVLAVEDLQWATRSTLAHLATLAATAADCPAILMTTSRSEQDPVDRGWRAETGASPLTTIELGPLRADEAAILAAPFLAAHVEAARRCIERAAGNPLFLDQLVRNAVEGADATLPGSIQNLVQLRIDRLEAVDKIALQAASVLGQRFDRDALAYLLGQTDYAPERLLSHLMVRAQGEEFLFAHALLHEAVYQSLSKNQRCELHRRAAEFFAARDAILRAEHLDRAEDPAAARAYLQAATSQAAQYRYEVARQLIERGLALATDGKDRFACASVHGEICHDLGDMPAALVAFEAALATAANDAERCLAWIGCAQVKRVTDDLDGAFTDLKRAEDAAVAGGMKLEEARLRVLRGNLLYARGDVDQCLGEHGRSLELSRAIRSHEHEAAALGGLGDAEYVRGRMISAHARLAECVELAQRHGFGRIEVANNAQLVHTMLYFRPQREALERTRAVIAAAIRIGHKRAELTARIAVLFALFALGDLKACRTEVDKTRALARRLGARRFEQTCLIFIGKIAHAEGRRGEAVDLLGQAHEISQRTGPSVTGPMIQSALAMALDAPDQRRAALAEAEALIKRGCIGHNQLRAFPDAIDVALELSNWDEAERYASQLEAFTRAEPLPWSDFFIARGRVLSAVGRGKANSRHHATLSRLLRQGKQFGYEIALPALRTALDEHPRSSSLRGAVVVDNPA